MPVATRTRLAVAVAATSTLWLLAAAGYSAQSAPPASDPRQLPLVQGGDLHYLGKFSVPADDGRGTQLSWGGNSLGLGADGKSLYFGCVYGTGVARLSVPEIGGTAELIEPCAGVPNLNAINPSDPNNKLLGGVLAWNNRLIVSAYSFYDGAATATKSHYAGTTIARAAGPFTVGKELPGLVAGYMGVIPQEWRALLGGPALTGQCCLSIITRTSYGPSVSVFDPDHVGTRSSIPSTMLVGYPSSHPELGDYGYHSPLFSAATQMGGVAFPAGTRSVLFVGRHGSTFCYGEGTSRRELHNTFIPNTDVRYCYDPTNNDKGTHGYPYKHLVWAYDASDLLAVKEGRKDPWQLRPYTTITLPEMTGGLGDARIASAAYDPATRRWYISLGVTTDVYVYEVSSGSAAGPSPPPRNEICGDGLDNDGDGQTDEDCSAPPSQPAPPEGPAPPVAPAPPESPRPPEGPAPPGSPEPPRERPGSPERPRPPEERPPDEWQSPDEPLSPRGSQPPMGSPVWAEPRVLAGSSVTSAALAACGTSVHVAHGNGAIYYRRSTTEGATWSDWLQLGDGSIPSDHSLACDGSSLVLTAHRGLHETRDWQGLRQVGDVWAWVSGDAGATWRAPVKLSTGAAAGYVSTALHGSRVAAAWMQLRGAAPGTWDIHYRESVDGGATWSTDRTLVAGATSAGAARPSVAITEDAVVVAWSEVRDGDTGCESDAAGVAPAPCASVYTRRLVAGGWSAEARLGVADSRTATPAVVAASTGAILGYASITGQRAAMAIARSADGGATWDGSRMLSSRRTVAETTLTATSPLLSAAWRELRDERSLIVLRVSTDGGVLWDGEESPFPDDVTAPRTAHSDGFLHVLGIDPRIGALHYARRVWSPGA